MTTGLSTWLAHPVTLVLVGTALVLLFVTTELLLRSLAELGNVRFQGMLEENPGLVGASAGVQVSLILDVGRWLQLANLGLLWMVVYNSPALSGPAKLAVCIGLPLLMVAVSRLATRPLSEVGVANLLRWVRPLVAPLVKLLVRVRPALAVAPAEDEEEEASEAEIQAYLEAGEAAGIFEGEEGEIVESLVDFFDTVVREVMTPRTDMVAVSDTGTFRELLEVFATTHKSRIPVYHETVDRIIGVVHVKNLVKYGLRGAEPAVAELARECLVVPESKELGDLLRDFQSQHQQMAIVVDEYGGTSGLVTLEDILEEIVGEIQDELDPNEPPEWRELSSGVYQLQGRAPLEVLGDLFDAEIDEDDVDTVGGLVFARHGTVPEAGAEVADELHDLLFTVDEMDERRIVSVTVRRASKPEDAHE